MNELVWIIKHAKNNLAIKKKILAWYKHTKNWYKFWSNYRKYNQIPSLEEKLQSQYLYPCLGEDTLETPIEPIYFYQDTWAFEKIIKQKPIEHIDVGSHHKFVAFLSKIVSVTMVDIRPLSLSLKSLKFKKGSILELPFEDESIESLSSLCVIEHIGLGRYGDSLDPKGSEKAIAELKRVIKKGGNLYISVPIDEENRTFFNAHRAFNEKYLEEMFNPFFIKDKAYIYGNQLFTQKQTGFGIGLYHLSF